jgi:hypothetical protein
LARNNRDRVGTDQTGGPKTRGGEGPPVVDNGNGLSFSTPTEFVEIPSAGKLYAADHPLHNQKFIEIRFMTARDEDILTSQALLKKGIAIDRFLANILIDKRIKMDDLYVGDKNALLIGSRITGYGEEYSCKVTCPSCGAAGDHDFDLSLVGPRVLDEENENVVSSDGDTFIIETPITHVKVELRYLKAKDEKHLLRILEHKRKKKLPETTLTDQLKAMIVSVNGAEDRETIVSFIDNLPARDSRHIRQVYQSVVPNIDLNQTFICDTCDYETDQMEVPFTTAFFWPGK